MYLEMLQQRYGSGMEKQSSALLGRGVRAMGRGLTNLGSKLSVSSVKLPDSVIQYLTNLGTKLSGVGSTWADPALRRMAVESFKRHNRMYKDMIERVATAMPGRTALLGGGLVGTGLGAGYLANELTQQ